MATRRRYPPGEINPGDRPSPNRRRELRQQNRLSNIRQGIGINTTAWKQEIEALQANDPREQVPTTILSAHPNYFLPKISSRYGVNLETLSSIGSINGTMSSPTINNSIFNQMFGSDTLPIERRDTLPVDENRSILEFEDDTLINNYNWEGYGDEFGQVYDTYAENYIKGTPSKSVVSPQGLANSINQTQLASSNSPEVQTLEPGAPTEAPTETIDPDALKRQQKKLLKTKLDSFSQGAAMASDTLNNFKW